MANNNPLPLAQAAAALGITEHTVRYHLRAAAKAEQPIAVQHAGVWLLAADDLPALRARIAAGKAQSQFQPGNELQKLVKKPGRPKNPEKVPSRNSKRNKDLQRPRKKSAAKG